MHAKQSKGTCNRPVNQWRLLQELKPVQPRRDPIAAGKHAARDLRLDGIDIVHQRWWRNNAAQKNNGGNRDHDQRSVREPFLLGGLLRGLLSQVLFGRSEEHTSEL